MIERAEALGYDSVWLRCRHLQPGISSPVAIMAAASQRTSRIELGTAVIPLGLENPFRLAEDLATVDILSGGRINPGVSVGTPMLYDHYKEALYPDTHDIEDFSKDRVLRLLRGLRGEPVSDFEGTVGIEQFTDRIQPHSPGLADRVWYGGGMSSATWAGEQGINYLTSSVVSIEGTESRDFATIQGENIDAFRASHRAPRKGAGVTGFGRHPHRLRHRRPDPPLPRVRGEPVRAHQGPAGPARHAVLPRLRRHAPTNWPTSCSPTRASSAPTKWRSPCRSPSTRTTTGRSSPTSPRISGHGSDGARGPPPQISVSPLLAVRRRRPGRHEIREPHQGLTAANAASRRSACSAAWRF